MNRLFMLIWILLVPIFILEIVDSFSIADNLVNKIQYTENSNRNKIDEKNSLIANNDLSNTTNSSWGKLTAMINSFSTAILAFLTLIYVILTFRILSEMKEAKEPAIEIDFDVKGNFPHEVFVWVKNAGLSPAKNIEVKVREKLPLSHIYELKDTKLSEANFIKKSIPYLAPGRSKKYVVGNLKMNPDIWKSEDYIVNFKVNFETLKSKKRNVLLSVDVLQCIDPLVFRGQECFTGGNIVKIEKEP